MTAFRAHEQTLSEEDQVAMRKLQIKLDRSALHTKVRDAHSEALREIREGLRPGTDFLVIIDFAKFASGNEAHAIDLVAVVFWKGTDGVLNTRSL